MQRRLTILMWRGPSHVYRLIVDSFNRDLGPTHRFLALTGGTNLDRANDHSAHEAGALREAIPRFPQRTFGRDRRHMKTHKDLRFTEARKLGHPAQHRALPASSGALGEGRHRVWGSHRAVSKDAKGFVQRGRGRRRCIAIQTIQNRWQVTSERYGSDVWCPG